MGRRANGFDRRPGSSGVTRAGKTPTIEENSKDRDAFLGAFRAPLALYKLLELRSARSPIFLPRTLSYRVHSRAVRWQTSESNTVSSANNELGTHASLQKDSVLKNFLIRKKSAKSKTGAPRLSEAPKFATLYLKGFAERSDVKGPGVSKPGREREVPITVGLYEQHNASRETYTHDDDSSSK